MYNYVVGTKIVWQRGRENGRADKKDLWKAEKWTHQDDTECAVDLCSIDLCGEYFQRKSVPASGDSTLFRCEAAGLGHDRSLASVDLRGGWSDCRYIHFNQGHSQRFFKNWPDSVTAMWCRKIFRNAGRVDKVRKELGLSWISKKCHADSWV